MPKRDKSTVQLEIYSDVICPWCYVGKARLSNALKEVTGELDVEVTWKPFELNPTMPEAGMDRSEYLLNKFGTTDISGMQKRLSDAGAGDGLQFNFSGIKIVPNTFKAHRLLWLAKKLGRQDALSEILFRKYFTDGQDIGQSAVLTEAAVEAGISIDQAKAFIENADGIEDVRQEEREGLSMGIHSVPSFVMNGKVIVAGAVPPAELAKLIVEAAANSLATA